MIRKIDIAIIGAQKSGTSSLAGYLETSPNLTSHKQLEFKFFVDHNEYQLGYENVYPKYFDEVPAGHQIMIKSVGLIYFSEATQKLYEHNPSCILIAILRNPVERAYSHYWYARQLGLEKMKTFEEALEAEQKKKNWTEFNQRHNAYIDRGMYANQLKTVYSIFGRENVQVVLFEEMAKNHDSVIRELSSELDIAMPDFEGKVVNKRSASKFPALSRLFLSDNPLKGGLKQIVPKEVRVRLASKIKTWNKKEFKPTPLSDATRQYLSTLYQQPNLELSELLERDLSIWDHANK